MHPRHPGGNGVHPSGGRLPEMTSPTLSMMVLTEELTGLLDRVALAVNSSLDLTDVLERLATLALEVCPAHRASIFLLNPSGTHLVPRTYVARADVGEKIANVEYGTRPHFTDMDPIDLAEIPARLSALSDGRAFTIADLAESPLVPPEVVRNFRARSAIIVPLVAPGEPLGIMTLDWMSAREGFDETEVVLLEAIGGYASLAVRNARVYEMRNEKATSLKRLVDAASSLNSSATRTDVVDLATTTLAELTRSQHCSAHLFDGRSNDEAEIISAICCPSKEPLIVDLPSETLDPLGITLPPAAESAVLFPLFRTNKSRGFLLVALDRGRRLGPDELELGVALCDLATAGLERAELYERLRAQLLLLEVLQNLSETMGGESDVPTALRGLNQVLVPTVGIEIESISLVGERGKKAALARPSEEEIDALRAWRHRTTEPIRPLTVGSGVLVPIVHGSRVRGVLRVRPAKATTVPFDEDLLLSLGVTCAEVINRASLQRELAEKEHSLAIAQERERIAQDLHDRVGQLVTALGMQLKDHASSAPDDWRERFEELADQASQGSRQIKEAIHSLLFLQVRRSGLVSSLRDLVRTFEATSGVATDFEIRGEPGNVSPEKEDVLFRVAHEAFTNIRRHSGASWVEVTLSYDNEEIALAIRDHGHGFESGRDPFVRQSGHLGLMTLRQRLEDVGGDLVVGNAHPHGVLVEARIGLRRRRAVSVRRLAE
jgi:signal transduction histidine kinase